jgi:hypothetical protein
VLIKKESHILTAKPGKGKGKTKETSANSTTAGAGVTVLSEKKLFLGQKVRFWNPEVCHCVQESAIGPCPYSDRFTSHPTFVFKIHVSISMLG